jgi:hypothetical protein
MTKIYSSSFTQVALALGLAVAAASGIASLVSSAQADEAHPRSGMRCFLGTNSDAKHSTSSGWVCVPERRSTDTH